MSALDMWARLNKDGWSEVERWLSEHEPESLHLDFKTKGAPPSDQLLSEADLGNAAKALSAFANVEGGVLVFGVKAQGGAKNEADRATTAPGVSFADSAANQLERRLASLTDPPIPGVQVKVVNDPSNPSVAIVALLAPASDGGPHRVSFGKESQVDRYYMRVASNSLPVPHTILAGMFGRRPPPSLRLAVRREPNGDGTLLVRNHGRGLARDIYVRVSVGNAHERDVVGRREPHPGWVHERPTAFRGAPVYIHAWRADFVLHALDTVRLIGFTNATPERALGVSARIDADGMAPVLMRTLVELNGGWVVDVPTVGEPGHNEIAELID